MNSNEESPREISSTLPSGDTSTTPRETINSHVHERVRSPAATAMKGSNSLTGYRMAGAGLELAASTLLLGALGYWIDHARGHSTPYVALVGLLAGFSAGLYRLIVLAMKTVDSEEDRG